MRSRPSSNTPTVDTVERPSTRTVSPPSVRVDSDPRHVVPARRTPTPRAGATVSARERPLTSLELLRQLEDFVRDLFDLTSAP